MTDRYMEVLAGKKSWSVDQADVLTWLESLPANSLDFVFGSPPYAGKGKRYRDVAANRDWGVFDWVQWMFDVSTAAVKACKGDVMWVLNGFYQKGEYHPAVEGLIWKWYEKRVTMPDRSLYVLDRPCIWYKNAPPNRKDYFGNDWEFVVCFRKAGKREVWDWESIAEAPKHKTGGRFRQRDAKGERKLGNAYPKGKLTRPRDVVRVTVGGGHMGSKLAHQNEAPFPEKLVERFLLALSPAGGIVCDPFVGSGTTLKVALKYGRRFVGCDIRESQVDLSTLRAAEAAP